MFLLGRDVAGYNSFLVNFPDIGKAVNLAANVAQSITIPSSSPLYAITFQYEPGSNIFITNSGTATVPSGTFSTTTSMLNPPGLQLVKGTVLSFITPDTTAYVIANIYSYPITGF